MPAVSWCWSSFFYRRISHRWLRICGQSLTANYFAHLQQYNRVSIAKMCRTKSKTIQQESYTPRLKCGEGRGGERKTRCPQVSYGQSSKGFRIEPNRRNTTKHLVCHSYTKYLCVELILVGVLQSVQSRTRPKVVSMRRDSGTTGILHRHWICNFCWWILPNFFYDTIGCRQNK